MRHLLLSINSSNLPPQQPSNSNSKDHSMTKTHTHQSVKQARSKHSIRLPTSERIRYVTNLYHWTITWKRLTKVLTAKHGDKTHLIHCRNGRRKSTMNAKNLIVDECWETGKKWMLKSAIKQQRQLSDKLLKGSVSPHSKEHFLLFQLQMMTSWKHLIWLLFKYSSYMALAASNFLRTSEWRKNNHCVLKLDSLLCKEMSFFLQKQKERGVTNLK